MMLVCKSRFLKIITGSCKFVQLAIFCEYTCEHGYDLCFNPILLKIDIHVRFMMIHV